MNKNNNMPKGWSEVELGFFMKAGTGSVDPSKFKGEIFELYSIPAYDSGKPEILIGEKIGSSKKVLTENDVLLSRIVPHIQRSWIVGKNQGHRQIGSGEWIIFDGSSINPKYLRYFLLSYGFHMKFMTTISGVGGSLTRANPNLTARFPIPIPPLNEQNRIVEKLDELLSELEKGKEQLQTSLAQMKVYRQSILKNAFEGRLTNEIANDGELPKTWTIKLVSEICDVVRGGSPRPAGDPRYYGGSIPFLKVADLTKDDKVYVYEYEYTIKEAGLKKTRQIKSNTLLLTNSGATLGVPKICKIDATMNDGIAAFLNLDERSNHYFYYFWKSKTRELRSLNQGAAQPNLNTIIIKNYQVPYCSFDEQQRVVEEIELRFSESEKLKEEILNSLAKSESLRSSILQKAFEGKLVEQNPNDEPASLLLERIKKEREEFLKIEKERMETERPLYIKSRKMAEELKRIIEILKESKEPVSAKTLWESSMHNDSIDDFYAELKKLIEAGEIKETRKGKVSLLQLVKAK